ncbi:hypothetical protein IY145_14470 [Methylosinus sp. H3A]|uniref:hypothetical protein n=1 Tax=Methylosinus sp. H3A TaxID=2785786 RepID=UPI0018C2B533|nr:hypothetical protein [Methylosinus sp. H3A]MBG0810574.1 hypothetical protein [Methylosinus sp. H3A]
MAGKQDALPRDVVAQAKLLYDAGVTPLAELSAMLGMSERAFRRYRVREGWLMRPSPIKCKSAAQPLTKASETEQPARSKTESRSLIARLEEAVEREFVRAEAALATCGAKAAPKTMETSARVLASLVRSLAELKRMNRDAGALREEDGRGRDAFDDEPPRELAELREELARRLERMCGEGEAR